MKQFIFYFIFISVFILPAFAQESIGNTEVEKKENLQTRTVEKSDDDKLVLKERKKKKGKRNVLVQPNDEDDGNIIMYLDENKVEE